MLFLKLLENWLKPWPDIHDKSIKFGNVQVKSSFGISSIRNPFPVNTLSVLLVSSLFCLETRSRSGWNQQEAEDGMFECTSEEEQTSSPRGHVQPGGQQGQLLWGELCLMPQKCPAATWPSNPKAVKGQRPERAAVFFLPHLLSWEVGCSKSRASPRIFCPGQSIALYWCKRQSAHLCLCVFAYIHVSACFPVDLAHFSPPIWTATVNKN